MQRAGNENSRSILLPLFFTYLLFLRGGKKALLAREFKSTISIRLTVSAAHERRTQNATRFAESTHLIELSTRKFIPPGMRGPTWQRLARAESDWFHQLFPTPNHRIQREMSSRAKVRVVSTVVGWYLNCNATNLEGTWSLLVPRCQPRVAPVESSAHALGQSMHPCILFLYFPSFPLLPGRRKKKQGICERMGKAARSFAEQGRY